jgi:molybdopterin-guanine dinucleotide biosynthesis protein A
MGTNKARLRLGPRTLLQHVLAAGRSAGFPVRVIRKDLVPACGPLGGLYTALKLTEYDAVLALACDMPFITPQLLQRMSRQFGTRGRSLFMDHRGRPGFPLLLSVSALPMVAKNLKRGAFSLHELARTLRTPRKTIRVEKHELANVNTPEEFAWAKSWLAARRNQTRPGRVRAAKA